MIKKIIISIAILASFTAFNKINAYEEIDCSKDSVFKQNSCNQCFVGWEKSEWGYIWLLDDNWINSTNNDMIMYWDGQDMPFMVNLSEWEVEWKQEPSSDKFWEFTEELKKLYNEEKLGYLLKAWQQVIRIKSKTGSAYQLVKNQAEAGKNIWMVIFPIKAYSIMEDWEVSVNNDEHRECVLFKSAWWKKVTKKTPAKTKKLPETGPAQFLVLLVLAMVLAFGVLRFRKS